MRARKLPAVQNRAAAIKILAEQRAGHLLSKVERAQGQDGAGLQATLAQSEIPETTGKRWQRMTEVPASEDGAELRSMLERSEIAVVTAHRWRKCRQGSTGNAC